MRLSRFAGRVLVCAAVCLMLLCAVFIAAEAGHDCSGDGCHVCVHMRLCLDMLQSLLFAVIVGAVTVSALLNPVRITKRPANIRLSALTLITLKVRMDG